MATCSVLAADNVTYLRQALDLVGRLCDEDYTRQGQPAYGSGIGSHLRHCLDHYSNFLAGLSAGRVDYDARARDPRIEQDRTHALSVLTNLIAGLQQLAATDGDRVIQVKMDCGDDADPTSWWTGSTVRRELQFLISHTVHHYALIAMILRLHKLDPGVGFGVAPSTLRYQAGLSCAR